MNRFIIHEGLPYLYADGKAYAVRWNDDGFTVGAEVDLTSAPKEIFEEDWPEISILAKCEILDSIGVENEEEPKGVYEEVNDEIEEPKTVGGEEVNELEKLTVAELKELAASKGIMLKSKVKAEIINEIEAV